MSIIAPYYPNHPDMEKLVPHLDVYALRANIEDPDDPFYELNGLISDCCWTEKRDVYEHHWFEKDKPSPHIVRMTLIDYLKAHWQEVPPMNPFEAAGRYNFLIQWCRQHKVELKKIVELKEAGGGRPTTGYGEAEATEVALSAE